MSENGNSQHETPALTGPVDERGTERRKSEQEIIAIAIFAVAKPDEDWAEIGGEEQQTFMRMAAAAVNAAQPPLPEPEVAQEPAYPAELLDKLAHELAWKYLNPQQFGEGVREALDSYEQEVGRENVPQIVAKAIAEL